MKDKINYVGFTLIELIIVLAIISILICIAYPVYSNYLVKVRRDNAAVLLINLAASLEQYYNDNHSYQSATIKNLGINNNNNFYQLKIISASATSYRIEAVPKGIQAKADVKCGCLILDQLGNKTISGTGHITNCWP